MPSRYDHLIEIGSPISLLNPSPLQADSLFLFGSLLMAVYDCGSGKSYTVKAKISFVLQK